MKKCRGITLIALVITIIVLLILTGVSLSLIVGEQGFLNRATKATLQTELATLEEKANLVYANLSVGQYWGSNQEVNLTQIIQELEKQMHTFKRVTTNDKIITGISVQDVNLKVGEEKELNVEFKENCEEICYYAEIRGKYYLMTLTSNGVKVARTPSQLESSGEIAMLSANVEPKGIVEIEIQKNIIKMTGISKGNVEITVTYGSYKDTCQVKVAVQPTGEEKPNDRVEILTDYGTIEVIWLDSNNGIIQEPNAPDLYNGNLIPVTWTENGEEWTEDESNWYNYIAAQSGDPKESQWANAKNNDGSYFVWIPRFAYRITYYESQEIYENQKNPEPTGYYDGYGMWRTSDANVKYALDKGIETVEHNGNRYIVHPAFMKDDDKEGLENYARGGWDSDLSGFWVAKYEMSKENGKLVSKPNVSSWCNINIGTMYTDSYHYDRSKESHLMKNSEWGAVAYLTHSQYGRNGHEIDANTSSSYITGTGGVNASTTGNKYGIYDMSGGANEWTACWNTLSTDNCINKYGNSFASTNGRSTKYATAYKGTDDFKAVFEVSKIGDAIKEIQSLREGWFNNKSTVASNSAPFFVRGGRSNNGMAVPGIFYSGSDKGRNINFFVVSFRVTFTSSDSF